MQTDECIVIEWIDECYKKMKINKKSGILPLNLKKKYLIHEHVIVKFTAYPMKRYNLKNSFDNQTASKI